MTTSPVPELLNALDDIVFAVNDFGFIERWNQAAAEVTGYTDVEAGTMTPADFFDAPDSERLTAAFTELFETGDTVVEPELVTAAGDHIPYEFRVTRLPEESPYAFVGIGHDITERKQAERGRDAMLDRLRDGCFATDTDRRATGTNETGEDSLPTTMGLTVEESTLQEPPEWDNIPDDTELSIYVRESTDQQQDRKKLAHREQVLKDLYRITADRDSTFTEQVERLLALGRAEFGTEYGSLSEIRGEKYLFEIVAADDGSIQAGDVVPVEATNCELVAAQRKTLAWGNIPEDAPEETDRAGYTDWGISCYLGAPVYDNDGVYGTFCFYGTDTRAEQFSGWDVTLVDLMSRWVSYELQRRQVTDELQRQNERLEEFASIVSHDLRNPLNVLQGRLELAEEAGDPEEFARCYDALDRMEALIDDLLTLAKAGNPIDDVQLVAVDTLASRAWGSVQTGGAALESTGSNTVQADASRLQQLFENLFRNAIEHSGEGVTVTIGTLAHGFYVEDDGPGLPEDVRDAVFESGYSTTTDGTGFGLAIVADIVEAHGWEIIATDSGSGGARFEITGID